MKYFSPKPNMDIITLKPTMSMDDSLYDYVVCTSIFYYNINPLDILKKASKLLREEGLIYICIDKNLITVNKYINEISINILKQWINGSLLFTIWSHEEEGKIFCYASKKNICNSVEKCNLCGSNDFEHIRYLQAREWHPVKKYYSEHVEFNPFQKLPEQFELQQCSRCGLVFVNPRIEDYVVNQFYNEYLANKYKNYMNSYDENFREYVFLNYLNDIEEYIPKSKSINFLDIGCASGLFLKVARDRGYKCYGIEVADSVGEKAKQYGKVYIGDVLEQLNRIEDDYFNLVTMIDSIEHFQKPKETIELVVKKIKKNGFIFIETPNYYAKSDEMSRRFYLFSHKTIKKLIQENGFEIIFIKETGNAYNPKDIEIKKRFLRVLARKER